MKKVIAIFCATIVLVAACILLVLLAQPKDTTEAAVGNQLDNTSTNISESTASLPTEQSVSNSTGNDGPTSSDDLTSSDSPATIDKPDDTETANSNIISIVRHPRAADFGRGTLAALPKYDASTGEGWQVDLRGYDLSGLDLSDRSYDLSFAEFDSKTTWPEKMPDSFKPEEIMETSKNPGLNVRALHKRGIDGRGVGIAIIDQCLLTDHVEYKDQLRFYDEIHCLDDTATMHGAAVSSIAVGKTVGVAPSADLYYIAETHGTISDGEFEYDFTWLAKSVDRILEITESVEKAKTAGILVVSSSLEETFGLRFHGLGRDPLKNADDYHSYEPGMFWEKTSGRTGDDS